MLCIQFYTCRVLLEYITAVSAIGGLVGCKGPPRTIAVPNIFFKYTSVIIGVHN